MSLDARLQELIRAAWNVMDQDFEEAAIMDWRQKASACLAEMFGPDHHYCREFEQSRSRSNRLSILAGGGVLEAAKAMSESDAAVHESAHAQATMPREWESSVRGPSAT
jgi:hypothetical protein